LRMAPHCWQMMVRGMGRSPVASTRWFNEPAGSRYADDAARVQEKRADDAPTHTLGPTKAFYLTNVRTKGNLARNADATVEGGSDSVEPIPPDQPT
jgi:hypothetical protein